MLALWKLLFEKHLILDVETTLRLQKPHCENFWTLRTKVISAIEVIKNKKQCFYVCLNRTCNLVLSSQFLLARLRAQVKLRARKIGRLEGNLSTPDYQEKVTQFRQLLIRYFIAWDKHFLSWLNIPKWSFCGMQAFRKNIVRMT